MSTDRAPPWRATRVLLLLAAPRFASGFSPSPYVLWRRSAAISAAVRQQLPEDDTDFYGLRFAGLQPLFGEDSRDRLAAARVCVIGLGGVGSWAVEALARSGVGGLTLVDLDEVCISNTNRQLHAL